MLTSTDLMRGVIEAMRAKRSLAQYSRSLDPSEIETIALEHHVGGLQAAVDEADDYEIDEIFDEIARFKAEIAQRAREEVQYTDAELDALIEGLTSDEQLVEVLSSLNLARMTDFQLDQHIFATEMVLNWKIGGEEVAEALEVILAQARDEQERRMVDDG